MIHNFKMAEIIGIDLLPAQIERVNEKIKLSIGNAIFDGLLIKLMVASAEDTKLENQSIDKILSVEVAQHFSQTYSFAMEVKRILKPSGKMVFASHFPTSSENCHKIKEENLGMQSIGEISIQEVILPFQQLGFKVSYFSIGEYVFDGYEKWISQINCKTYCSHFFYKAYKKKYIDYFVITVSY